MESTRQRTWKLIKVHDNLLPWYWGQMTYEVPRYTIRSMMSRNQELLFSCVCILRLVWDHDTWDCSQLFKQDVEQLEKISSGKQGKRVNKIVWELEKLLSSHRLEAQCVYSSEKVDIEVISNQTDMATASHGWKLRPYEDEVRRKHETGPEQQWQGTAATQYQKKTQWYCLNKSKCFFGRLVFTQVLH